MGGTTGRQSKKYAPPIKQWDAARIERDKQLKKIYGFKNKRELWKEESFLRTIRKRVRELIGLKAIGKGAEEEKIFLKMLSDFGLVKKDAVLDDVLDLKLENVLDRRLQMIVFKRGMAPTIKSARQLIVHGHVLVGDRVVTSPSYLVKTWEEETINYVDPKFAYKPNTENKAE